MKTYGDASCLHMGEPAAWVPETRWLFMIVGACTCGAFRFRAARMRRHMLRVFRPILAGATLRERMIACVGALIGIFLTSLVCGRIASPGEYLPLIIAPMGASAVLL